MSERPARPPSYYDRLGVKPTASPQQIRQAFRDLSKLYHPDTTTLPAAEATAKFQDLNEAYAMLSSPDRRWAYDQQAGYSRISVMQPLESLTKASQGPSRREPSNLYLDPNDRPLSPGEIFALFILGLTFAACLALVVTVGLTRGDPLVTTALNDPEQPSYGAATEVEAAPSQPPITAPTVPYPRVRPL